RRFTAKRTFANAMKPKASAAADRNTNALTIRVELSPSAPLMMSNTASMSDPEIAHLVHHDVAGEHPRAGEAEAPFGDVVLDDCAVEIRRHHVDEAEHRDRKARQEQRRELTLGGERADLAPHLEALADHAGEVREDFGEIAAGRTLNGD